MCSSCTQYKARMALLTWFGDVVTLYIPCSLTDTIWYGAVRLCSSSLTLPSSSRPDYYPSIPPSIINHQLVQIVTASMSDSDHLISPHLLSPCTYHRSSPPYLQSAGSTRDPRALAYQFLCHPLPQVSMPTNHHQ